MENEESVAPDPIRVQIAALNIMDHLDILVEEGFTEVEMVGALLLISSKLSETMEEAVKDGTN